jgi:NADH-quinone oxidoreductase subunit N
MTIGNLVALQQTQIVRLLAYSSIAQAGYMLLPFALVGGTAATDRDAFAAAVLYILIYAVMNLGAFAVVVAMARESPNALITDFAGLSRRAPILALGMAVFMVSLAGIPPTAGFWAKLFIFSAAIERGGLGPYLAVIMVVNSVISLYYYVAVAKQIYLVEGEDRPLATPALITGVTVLAMLAVVALFVYPDLLARFPPGSTLVGP